MKVKDPYFILEKIRKYLDEDIRPSRYRMVLDLENWKYFETSMEKRLDDAGGIDYDDSSWQDFKLWDTWGGYDQCAWFRTTVTIPEAFKKGKVALRFLVGPRDGGDSTAESLLYINGRPIQGIDIWHEEALLDDTVCAASELSIALKAWSGVLGVPKFRTFKLAQLVQLDMNVDKFFFVADTVLRSALLLDENDLRRIRLTKLLNETFKRVNFLNYGQDDYYESIGCALAYIQKELDEMAKVEEIKPTVYGVGHSHIDMAWLWRLDATREKASRTFSTVLNLMKQYPEYKFMHTSPQLYKFLKADHREIFDQVKRKIEDGQWEITGGMWVEPDTNIPSGESLVRQFLYGKRYIRDEFGKETYLAWLPDVFGYSAAMPQIMKKSGMKYFMTTKISWNQYNHFPYDTFMWKGLDGSEIFTHFITTPEDGSWYYTYNGHMDPEEVTGIWKNYKDKDKNEELLIAYGWGDGGGGPTREMLEQTRVMKNIPGIPKAATISAEGFFERIYQNVDHDSLGRWNGELYFELHRGTYTSQAANKKYNRQLEVLLHNLEFLAAAADVRNQSELYPKEQLDRIWERLLLNQFHDILPGSSIRQVYEDTTKDYQWMSCEGEHLLNEAGKRMTAGIQVSCDSVAVYNTSGFTRDDYVLIPYDSMIESGTCLQDDGKKLDIQRTEEGLLCFVKNIPAYGYKTLAISRENSPEEIWPDLDGKAEEIHLTATEAENKWYLIRLNENGEISHLYDKVNDRTVSCEQPMNVFAAYEDKPQRFDAWDVDVYYKEKPYQPFKRTEAAVIENGRERAILRQTWIFNQSVLTQDMILYNHSPRIDFQTTVDWKEKNVFLKTYFPVDIHSSEATYEIQFGNIKRPTHTNNEWDFARFEVSGHRWADLSEGDYGVALLNDCKYGWDIQKNVIGLSLLKSAIRPDETADRKVHTFTYSLYPHKGRLEDSAVQKQAMYLNMPLVTMPVAASESNSKYAAYSFVSTDSDHVIVDTVKMAEDDRACVIRVYEYKNMKDEQIRLTFSEPVTRIIETNLCEEGACEIRVQDNQVTFPVGCYEIRTFKVYF